MKIIKQVRKANIHRQLNEWSDWYHEHGVLVRKFGQQLAICELVVKDAVTALGIHVERSDVDVWGDFTMRGPERKWDGTQFIAVDVGKHVSLGIRYDIDKAYAKRFNYTDEELVDMLQIFDTHHNQAYWLEGYEYKDDRLINTLPGWVLEKIEEVEANIEESLELEEKR